MMLEFVHATISPQRSGMWTCCTLFEYALDDINIHRTGVLIAISSEAGDAAPCVCSFHRPCFVLGTLFSVMTFMCSPWLAER